MQLSMIHTLHTSKANLMIEHQNAINLLLHDISQWVTEFGFDDFGIADIDLSAEHEAHKQWLDARYNAGMGWIEENTDLRLYPEKLVPGTHRIISVRLNYLPSDTELVKQLKKHDEAYISRYALGRDYHKLMRKRLAQLGKKIEARALELGITPSANTRAFVDSAPVLERPLAEKSGLGWTGKHTLIINEKDGSWFFLGELFTNIPLPCNQETPVNQCGDCEACMQICPTDAFPKPYVLDASRCISYLTIEHKGSIPIEFREPMGNRIFGCDDCQLICPWNKYAKHTAENDFNPRHNLQSIELLTLFAWTEEEFLRKTEGSAIRRTGFENWQRNLSIALGNAPKQSAVIDALKEALTHCTSATLKEHFEWAIMRQQSDIRRKRKIRNPNTTKNGRTSDE